MQSSYDPLSLDGLKAANQLLTRIIIEVDKFFIEGNKISQRINETATKPEFSDQFLDVLGKKVLADKKDPRFTRDVNVIPNSHLAAGRGLRRSELAYFFDDTLFNKAFPINRVIALGTRGVDYSDYTKWAGEIVHPTNGYRYKIFAQKQFNGTFSAKNTKGEVEERELIEMVLSVRKFKTDHPDGLEKILTVTMIDMVDNSFIDFNAGKNNPSLCQQYWHLFEKSEQENVLVHCRAGYGRTGHVILTKLLLKEIVNGLFNSNDPRAIATIIKGTIDTMRSVRPALILTIGQCHYALHAAYSLYLFGLTNKYITQAKAAIEEEEPAPIKCCNSSYISQTIFSAKTSTDTPTAPSIPKASSYP